MSDYLTYVREQGCVVRGRKDRCFGPVQAHHVRTAANAGMGMKPPDTAGVGLCHCHHRCLHQIGRHTFEARYGVDLAAEAARLALEYPTTPREAPQPPTEGHPIMDIATPDPLDVLRQAEAELEQEARDASLRLDTVRGLIARMNVKQRAARKPRTATLDAGPQPIAVSLEAALDRLGTAVHAQAAELADAALPEAA